MFYISLHFIVHWILQGLYSSASSPNRFQNWNLLLGRLHQLRVAMMNKMKARTVALYYASPNHMLVALTYLAAGSGSEDRFRAPLQRHQSKSLVASSHEQHRCRQGLWTWSMVEEGRTDRFLLVCLETMSNLRQVLLGDW